MNEDESPLVEGEAVEEEVGVAKPKVTTLTIGYYLVHGTTHALHRVGGEVWRGDRRFQAQRELAKLNAHEWAILEVTANNYAWGE